MTAILFLRKEKVLEGGSENRRTEYVVFFLVGKNIKLHKDCFAFIIVFKEKNPSPDAANSFVAQMLEPCVPGFCCFSAQWCAQLHEAWISCGHAVGSSRCFMLLLMYWRESFNAPAEKFSL